MNELQLSLRAERTKEPVYAGFRSRGGAMLLDMLILTPVFVLNSYLNSLHPNVYLYSIVPMLALGVWYDIYLPKRYGGTPGKLLSGLTITRVDLQPIGWKEAFLRHSVNLLFTLLSAGIMLQSVLIADQESYAQLSWHEQSKYLKSLSPWSVVYSKLMMAWSLSELVILLTNSKKRALHDFIAGTVVVRTWSLARVGNEKSEPEEDLNDDGGA